jgi:hypothetical protein
MGSISVNRDRHWEGQEALLHNANNMEADRQVDDKPSMHPPLTVLLQFSMVLLQSSVVLLQFLTHKVHLPSSILAWKSVCLYPIPSHHVHHSQQWAVCHTHTLILLATNYGEFEDCHNCHPLQVSYSISKELLDHDQSVRIDMSRQRPLSLAWCLY